MLYCIDEKKRASREFKTYRTRCAGAFISDIACAGEAACGVLARSIGIAVVFAHAAFIKVDAILAVRGERVTLVTRACAVGAVAHLRATVVYQTLVSRGACFAIRF